MTLSSLSVSCNLTPKRQQSLKANPQKHKENQIHFSAQKYPTGHYSDWFVDLVKQKINVTEKAFTSWMETELNNFKAIRKKDRGWFSGEAVREDVSVRQTDFINLRKDLQTEQGHRNAILEINSQSTDGAHQQLELPQPPEIITTWFDTPKNTYSSKADIERQCGKRDDDFYDKPYKPYFSDSSDSSSPSSDGGDDFIDWWVRS